jgi:STIP1 family protein 1
MVQVVRLAETTGTSFSSTDMVFVGHADDAVAEGGGRLTAAEAFERVNHDSAESSAEREVENAAAPDHFCDPVTFEVMEDPVQTPSGHTFERTSILLHISQFGNNPFTREPLQPSQLVPNRSLKEAISKFQKDLAS